MPFPAAYAEYPPSEALRAFVECYWTRGWVPAAAAAGHRVLPDGCIDLLFTFDERGEAPAASGAGDAATVVGTMSRPLVVPPGGRLSFLGVRFRPGGAQPFLGVPAAALTDQRVPLADVWGDRAPLVDALAAEPDLAGRLRVLDAALRARLAAAAIPPRDLALAVREILRAEGRVRVEALSRTLGVSRQHLARRFAEHVGLTPKALCRVVRGRAALARAEAARSPGWSTLAADLGYADQSHLVAELKTLTGLTPARWLAARAAAADAPAEE